MKKNAILMIVAFAAICLFSSCSKICVCTATLNGQTLDQVTYEDVTGPECEAKVDEAMQRAIDTYDSESLIGLNITCSHL